MEPKISVIMSIYNEPVQFIIACIESIKIQTFSEFEVIVVLDKPDRKQEISDLFLNNCDNRFKLFCNESNFGLAKSMNFAASLSSCDILARMDADDVCIPERFEMELKGINQGFDVVFSKYLKINEEGEKISNEIFPSTSLSPQQISAGLLYRNSYIHHPTVMMKKSALMSVDGYREFPCSQDFDLWLRMNEKGLSFYMCEEPLLYYRVNSSSISSLRWFQQRLTIFYIFRLSLERLFKKTDSFTLQSYDKYLKKNGIESLVAQKKLKEALSMHSRAIELRKSGKKGTAILLQCRSFFYSSPLRKYNFHLLTKHLVIAINKHFR